MFDKLWTGLTKRLPVLFLLESKAFKWEVVTMEIVIWRKKKQKNMMIL